MWNWPVLLVHMLLQCPPRLCPWSSTLRHVHHSSQYTHFLLFSKPTPLCRRHSALSFLPSNSLWLQHRSPSQCSRSNLFLYDCKPSNTEQYLPRLNFCSLVSINNLPKSTTPQSTPLTLLETSASYLMNTSLFLTRSHLSPNLLLPYSSASLYPSIPLYQNSFQHHHFIVHSKLDYCNSLYHNLPRSQITWLQQIQNSLARAVVKAPKFSLTTLILQSLHWLKITECIEYAPLTYLQSSHNHQTFISA